MEILWFPDGKCLVNHDAAVELNQLLFTKPANFLEKIYYGGVFASSWIDSGCFILQYLKCILYTYLVHPPPKLIENVSLDWKMPSARN